MVDLGWDSFLSLSSISRSLVGISGISMSGVSATLRNRHILLDLSQSGIHFCLEPGAGEDSLDFGRWLTLLKGQ